MKNMWIFGALLVCACNLALADEKVFDFKRVEEKPSVGTDSSSGASSVDMIAEGDMTRESLEDLFKSAFFKTTTLGDDDLSVQVSSDRSVRVHIDRLHKLLLFYKVFGFKNKTADVKRIELANRINSKVIWVRASAPDDHSDSLVVDYSLPYDGSILTYQIVSSLRYFADVALKAVSQQDTEDIVK